MNNEPLAIYKYNSNKVTLSKEANEIKMSTILFLIVWSKIEDEHLWRFIIVVRVISKTLCHCFIINDKPVCALYLAGLNMVKVI